MSLAGSRATVTQGKLAVDCTSVANDHISCLNVVVQRRLEIIALNDQTVEVVRQGRRAALAILQPDYVKVQAVEFLEDSCS